MKGIVHAGCGGCCWRPAGWGARSLVVCALAVVAGCTDPVDPPEIAEAYVLTSVAGEPLPAVLMDNGFYRHTVTSDVLVLHEDGSGRRTTAGEREGLAPPGPVEPFTWELDLTYETDEDDRIVIAYVCRDDASCIAPPHLIARRVPAGLRAESRLGERGPLVYEPALEASSDG